jgi:hypothetical protein
MKTRNLVKLRVSYHDVMFEFDDVDSAARFMDDALEHISREGSADISIRMERVVVETEEE